MADSGAPPPVPRKKTARAVDADAAPPTPPKPKPKAKDPCHEHLVLLVSSALKVICMSTAGTG